MSCHNIEKVEKERDEQIRPKFICHAASRVVNNVFSGRLKTSINVDVVTSGGKLFHTRMPATPKTQSPVSAERRALTATRNAFTNCISENAVRGV